MIDPRPPNVGCPLFSRHYYKRCAFLTSLVIDLKKGSVSGMNFNALSAEVISEIKFRDQRLKDVSETQEHTDSNHLPAQIVSAGVVGNV